MMAADKCGGPFLIGFQAWYEQEGKKSVSLVAARIGITMESVELRPQFYF